WRHGQSPDLASVDDSFVSRRFRRLCGVPETRFLYGYVSISRRLPTGQIIGHSAKMLGIITTRTASVLAHCLAPEMLFVLNHLSRVHIRRDGLGHTSTCTPGANR